ncbi:MAG: hypothetical protein KC503_35405 [Myxococcales bacterium]|nr:hypothetical protein [Myxococcales bacterium]
MGILDELSSSTGNKTSNDDVVKRCLQTPALLHTVAEGLRTGTPKARVDCAQIMHEVAKRRPDICSTFVGDFIDASRDTEEKGGSKRIAKIGYSGMMLMTATQGAEIFAEREKLFEASRRGDALSIEAAKVLAELCRHSANYRGKLLGPLMRLMPQDGDGKELFKWIQALAPAVEGSVDGLKRFNMVLEPLREKLDDATNKKVDKLVVKLERSTVKKTTR